MLAFVGSLSIRNTLGVDVMRDRGVLGREVAGGLIENVYSLQFINKTERSITVSLSVEGFPGAKVVLSGPDGMKNSSSQLSIAGASNRLVPVVVRAPVESAQPGSHPIKFITRQLDAGPAFGKEITETSVFFVPK
jgi:polyferredoxin